MNKREKRDRKGKSEREHTKTSEQDHRRSAAAANASSASNQKSLGVFDCPAIERSHRALREDSWEACIADMPDKAEKHWVPETILLGNPGGWALRISDHWAFASFDLIALFLRTVLFSELLQVSLACSGRDFSIGAPQGIHHRYWIISIHDEGRDVSLRILTTYT